MGLAWIAWRFAFFTRNEYSLVNKYFGPRVNASQTVGKELLEKGTVVTSLYKGITNHSQTLGMVSAFWIVFLYADFIFHIRRADKLYLALLLGGLFLVYKSSCRTAMGTFFCGVFISSWYLLKMKGVGVRWRGKVVSGLLIFGALSAAGILFSPGLRQSVIKFVLKYADDSEGALKFESEAALKTRQFLVDEQMFHFYQKPTIGWGFQVSEDVAEMVAHSDSIPLSAPVEKGVWLTAILEEGGVFGEIIYCAYALIALVLLLSRKAYFGATMFWVIHISNLGELTMFSMSGAGGLWYTFLFIALAFDAKRMQALKWRKRGIV